MMEQDRGPNVIANFWEWYERRQRQGQSALAHHALDRCDDAFRRSEWERFGYWFSIYRNNRPAATGGPRKTERR